MHKGEFYAILPKDAKVVSCTIEVFKKKSARYRLKPRMVSVQGREDDVTPCVLATNPINKDTEGRKERYNMPAPRQQFVTIRPSNYTTPNWQQKNNIHIRGGWITERVQPLNQSKIDFGQFGYVVKKHAEHKESWDYKTPCMDGNLRVDFNKQRT